MRHRWNGDCAFHARLLSIQRLECCDRSDAQRFVLARSDELF